MSGTWGGSRPGAGRKATPRVEVEKKRNPRLLPATVEKKRTLPSAEMMLALVEASRRRGRGTPHALTNPFVFPQFPKNALPPKSEQFNIAMDEAFGWANGAWQGQTVGEYAGEGLVFLGYPYLSELAQRPEYRVISETIADDATRKWIDFEVTGDEDENRRKAKADPEGEAERMADPDERKKRVEAAGKTDKAKALRDDQERLDVCGRFYDLARNDGFFGRAHLFTDLGVGLDGDPDELKTPIGDGRDAISLAKVGKGSFKALRVVEPIWAYPTAYNAINPLRNDWYNPETWFVMGQSVHKSRLPAFVGHPVPDILKPAYSFGGIALSQMAKPYVDIWLTTRQSVADLIHSFSVMVLLTDLETLLQPSAGGGDLLSRAMLFNALRDNQGVFMVNKETEDFKNISAPISGLDHLQAQAQEHMSSVSRIPLVKLTGISPSGLNASSEGEIQVYDDTIIGYQNRFMRPNLTRIINFEQLSLWGEVDPELTYVFKPLREMTEKERGEKQKAEAERDKIYVDGAAISPEEWRKAIIDNPELPYTDLNPEDVPEPPDLGEEGGDPDGGGGGKEGDFGVPVGSKGRPGAEDANILPFGRASDAEFNEADHPRGQPGNAGQFGTGGGGSKTGSSSAKKSQPGTGSGSIKDKAGKSYAIERDDNGGVNGFHYSVKDPETGETVSDFYLDKANGSVRGAWTYGENAGKGIASAAYAHIEQDLGKKLVPSEKQTESGKALWAKREREAATPAPLPAKGLKRVGAQMGSNPGGVFEDATGQRFYVKAGRSKEHVANELAAVDLYKLAGVPTLDYRPVEGGEHVATAMAKLDKDNARKLSPAERARAQEDFVAHAWLANWDAVGTGSDNLGTVGGVPTPLDLGGALLYRAQGAPKGKAFGAKVGEIDSMRDASVSPDAAAVFGKMTDEQLRSSAEKVVSIPDASIRQAVETNKLPGDVANVLIARKRDIAKRFSIQAADHDAAFDETDAHGHEHAPAGSSTGGQFVSQGGGGGSSSPSEGGGVAKEIADLLKKPPIAGGNYRRSLVKAIKQAKASGDKDTAAALTAKLIGSWEKTHANAVKKGQGDVANKIAAKIKKLGGAAPAPAAAPAAPMPKSLVEAFGGPEALPPAQKKHPPATTAEKEKAKKATATTGNLLGVTSYPGTSAHTTAEKAIKDFNDKYEGKTGLSDEQLDQKVADFKDLQGVVAATNANYAAHKEKQEKEAKATSAKKAAEAKAKAEALVKEAKAAAAAKNKQYMEALGISETEAVGFDALVQMMGGNAGDVIEKFKGYENQAKGHGYPISGFQYALIRNYIDGGYIAINKALRSNQMTAAQHVYAKLVNNALDKMPKYTGIVQRGTSLPASELERYKPGFVTTEHSFLSTGIGYHFGGEVEYTIKANGMRGADFSKGANQSEKEVLFKVNTAFLVHKVEKKGGKTYIEMEEVDHHG